MFVGHYAVALTAKRAAPRASLGALAAAASALYRLGPLLVLAGWEWYTIATAASPFLAFHFDHYPWSHSLLAAFVWATFAAALYQWGTRYAPGTLTVWLLVVSHWVLDALVHRPDMPITPRSPALVGLGIWSHPVATVAIELALLAVGVALYRGVTRPIRRSGTVGLWAFVAILLVSYAITIASPPAPGTNPAVIAAGGLAGGALLIAIAWWLDRGRAPTLPA
jgi:membrane-bound metal-dependent hydrolase YbcI (DUF457 family)